MHEEAKNSINDERTKITRSMEALSASRDNRSAIAQLREIWPDIELALNAGVKHDAIWQELKTLGYKITRRNFASAIQRIRKERAAPPAKTSISLPANAQPPPPASPHGNPIKGLASQKKEGEFNPIPTAFELDHNAMKGPKQ